MFYNFITLLPVTMQATATSANNSNDRYSVRRLIQIPGVLLYQFQRNLPHLFHV